MLKSLRIENYALIDSLDISFDPGFTVITGETGAGKSIIIGALSLILGQRADMRQIKEGEGKCLVEGVVDISSYDLKPLFDEHDWVYDGDLCILRREIWANGKSRAFVNDSPVYLNDLKVLGDRLIDVHSQHQNLALNDNMFQLSVVDALANSKSEKMAYEVAYNDFKSLEKELNELYIKSKKDKEEEDFLKFQFDTLCEADLQKDEQVSLESELETLSHAEEIKSSLFEASNLLSQDDVNILSQLRSVLDYLQKIEGVYPKAGDFAERIEECLIDLKDVSKDISGSFDDIEFDPERQQMIEERLSLIYTLEKKHSVSSVEELIELRENIGKELGNIESLDERIEDLENRVEVKRSELMLLGKQLSEKRKSVVSDIEKELTKRLSFLKIKDSKFKCDFKEKKHPDITGIDDIEFLFSANKNKDLQPVGNIASGGEISRLMLSIKAMIAGATSLPTLIFDEIDTGTSGDVADRLGDIMKEMSNKMQVISITHLPQIAAKGDSHMLVYKEDVGDEIVTNMKVLSKDERIEQLASMLSGSTVTSEAIENAKVMLGV
ncbi:MAG: DNA repair protein RecN [Fermentimonas sp.]|jgi:DNA repair protein RecN (Recombination protein N)